MIFSQAEKLVGRKIVKVNEEKDGYQIVLVLMLDNGDKVKVSESGSPGADSEWYNYPVVKVNDVKIWNG